MNEYKIEPCPKPRQTRRDKWAKRPAVMRYRVFADEVRLKGVRLPESGYHILFVLPMPQSWSRKKKAQMNGQPHQQRPDIDNLLKGIMDAIYGEDCTVWDGRVTKLWGEEGKIIISAIDSHDATSSRLMGTNK